MNLIDAITLFVPWTPPKKLTPNYLAHWATKSKLRQEGRDAVVAAVRAARNAEGLFGDDDLIAGKARLSVVIRWGAGRRALDPDNAVACLKGPVDGLVQAHVIVNDSRKWLEWGPVTQETDKTGRGELVLRLEALL